MGRNKEQRNKLVETDAKLAKLLENQIDKNLELQKRLDPKGEQDIFDSPMNFRLNVAWFIRARFGIDGMFPGTFVGI